MSRLIRVGHVITGLGTGGAETMLMKLVTSMDRSRFETLVISLTGGGTMGPQLEAAGIPVEALQLGTRPLAAFGLRRLLRRFRADVVQTWMYHADFVGGLAARSAGIRGIAWNIRQTHLGREGNKPTTLFVASMCARLSRTIPRIVVCASAAARDAHVRFGYAADRMHVIPNGFDLEGFRPDEAARRTVRDELNAADGILVGLVARFDPQKDHANFIRAAASAALRDQRLRFVMCGDGIDGTNEELGRLLDASGAREKFILLGLRRDVPRIMAALDLAVSSSFGEGFPNVVGEAMCCGVPVVVTDVGDSALLVGEAGRVVPPRDSAALAEAIGAVTALPAGERGRIGAAARARIEQHFSLPAIVGKYEQLYEELSRCVD